jgi:hypothetical protein
MVVKTVVVPPSMMLKTVWVGLSQYVVVVSGGMMRVSVPQMSLKTVMAAGVLVMPTVTVGVTVTSTIS